MFLKLKYLNKNEFDKVAWVGGNFRLLVEECFGVETVYS